MFNSKQLNTVSQEGVFSPNIYAIPKTSMKYCISITDNISDVFIYDEVLAILDNAEEGDEVIFTIASYGGHLNSLLSLRSSILSTRAEVTGKLVSHSCSAAGMLLLSCHNKVVYPNTTFHAHNATYGVYGKSADIKAQVDFETKQLERLMVDVYGGFLDVEKEIPLLLEGKEFYFSSEETLERIINQNKYREELEAKQIQQEIDEANKPADLSDYTTEELEAELGLYQEDIKMIRTELKKRLK
ncbi:putative ATP-dependent Clp protease [Acinetobacter phage Phab24]|nr:putative ATP-dependent Clp protease [Acinetobacter phage Phab24]